MSELRRAARRLVETRREAFESRYPLEDSKRRLEAGLAKIPAPERSFAQAWSGDEAHPVLTASFDPAPRILRFLKLFSVILGLVMAGAVASWFVSDGALPWVATISAALAFLFFPFVILGLSSHQDARDARIKRAIRIALLED